MTTLAQYKKKMSALKTQRDQAAGQVQHLEEQLGDMGFANVDQATEEMQNIKDTLTQKREKLATDTAEFEERWSDQLDGI